MADDIDRAQERDQALLEAQQAYRKPEGPSANGRCRTCETPLNNDRRWCDADCRDEYDRRHPAPYRRRN